ncbi:hypothetical protein HK097_004863, partial [Rhizophlyctis rosea]
MPEPEKKDAKNEAAAAAEPPLAPSNSQNDGSPNMPPLFFQQYPEILTQIMNDNRQLGYMLRHVIAQNRFLPLSFQDFASMIQRRDQFFDM